MAVLQVLSEVIGSEELFGLVALAKLVKEIQMLCANVPLRRIRVFLTAVAASIRAIGNIRAMERGLDACKRCTGPGVQSKMQRVLVSLRLVLVLKAIRTVGASILFFGLVLPVRMLATTKSVRYCRVTVTSCTLHA